MFSQHLGNKQSLFFLIIRVQPSIPLLTTPLLFSPLHSQYLYFIRRYSKEIYIQKRETTAA